MLGVLRMTAARWSVEARLTLDITKPLTLVPAAERLRSEKRRFSNQRLEKGSRLCYPELANAPCTGHLADFEPFPTPAKA